MNLVRTITAFLFSLALCGTAMADVRADVESELTQLLRAAVNNSAAQIKVSSWKVSRDALLAGARLLKHVDLLPGERPYGKVTARAELVSANGTTSTVFVLADVDVRIPVWVAKRRIGSGAPLNGLVVASEYRSLAGLSASVIRASAPLTGRIAARTLTPGTILTHAATTTPRLVRRGNPVNIQVRIGNVLIRAQGRALAAGRLGDLIRVRLEGRRQVLNARVEGPNKVSVQP
jgi:flagellar basal body P-ring formation protein FlgA